MTMRHLTQEQIEHLRGSSEAFRQGELIGRTIGAQEILEAIQYCEDNLTTEQKLLLGRYLLQIHPESGSE